MSEIDKVCRELGTLHPVCMQKFITLAMTIAERHAAGRLKHPWAVFETFRHPDRQRALFLKKTTKATAWSSPHQYGLAADFVARPQKGWTWDIPLGDYAEIHELAKEQGLLAPISWDPGHIEAPEWPELRKAIKRLQGLRVSEGLTV